MQFNTCIVGIALQKVAEAFFIMFTTARFSGEYEYFPWKPMKVDGIAESIGSFFNELAQIFDF
jgi:hypothetical protein